MRPIDQNKLGTRCVVTHQAMGVFPMLFQCCTTISDGGSTLKLHRTKASCLAASSIGFMCRWEQGYRIHIIMLRICEEISY